MSILSKLNLKTVKRHTGIDPTINKRRKLIDALKQQIELIEADISGKDFVATKKVWVKDETGESVLMEVPKRVRAWHFEQDTGWYIQARYGQKVINLSPRNNSVFVSKREQIPSVYKELIKAVDNGELDSAIEAVSQQRRLAV
jgi:hypothetical protein